MRMARGKKKGTGRPKQGETNNKNVSATVLQDGKIVGSKSAPAGKAIYDVNRGKWIYIG